VYIQFHNHHGDDPGNNEHNTWGKQGDGLFASLFKHKKIFVLIVNTKIISPAGTHIASLRTTWARQSQPLAKQTQNLHMKHMTNSETLPPEVAPPALPSQAQRIFPARDFTRWAHGFIIQL
jgi:hypothetical protein